MAWGKSWQSGGGGGDGALRESISEVAASIAPLETDWDTDKMEKKLFEYFLKAAKNFQFRGRSLPSLVNEYADNAMTSIFGGLGDREWLLSGQADFLLCIDAGVKEFFPQYLLKHVEQVDFEQLVLAAYDRAFDEQRFYPILSEVLPQVVSGPKTKKKVWNAIDAGRKDAVASGNTSVEDFTQHWIGSVVANISECNWGAPQDLLSQEDCGKLFTSMLEGNGLPLSLTQDGSAAPLESIPEIVAAAYAENTIPEEAWESTKKKRKKGGGGGGGGGGGDPWSVW